MSRGTIIHARLMRKPFLNLLRPAAYCGDKSYIPCLGEARARSATRRRINPKSKIRCGNSSGLTLRCHSPHTRTAFSAARCPYVPFRVGGRGSCGNALHDTSQTYAGIHPVARGAVSLLHPAALRPARTPRHQIPNPRFVASPQLCSSGMCFRIITAPCGLSPQYAYRVGRTRKAPLHIHGKELSEHHDKIKSCSIPKLLYDELSCIAFFVSL